MAFSRTDQFNAYNMATQTVRKTKQVVMLYDGVIRFAQQARVAIEETRIEDRYNLLVKASEVLIGLQGCLDFKNGGEIAPLLYDYYSSLDARIIYVQGNNDLKILDAVIDELKQMRGAWEVVDTKSTGEEVEEPTPTMTPEPTMDESVTQQDPAVAATVAADATAAIDNSIFVSA